MPATMTYEWKKIDQTSKVLLTFLWVLVTKDSDGQRAWGRGRGWNDAQVHRCMEGDIGDSLIRSANCSTTKTWTGWCLSKMRLSVRANKEIFPMLGLKVNTNCIVIGKVLQVMLAMV